MIVITGLKHAGKSTVARALESEAGYRLYDIDRRITEQQKQGGYATARDAYAALGWRQFRAAEFDALRQSLRRWQAERKAKTVIDCGGGIVDYRRSRRLLKRWAGDARRSRNANGIVLLYLRANSDIVAQRFGTESPPAFLAAATTATGDSRRWQAQWRTVARRRARAYAGLATVTIDADLFTPIIDNPKAICSRIEQQIADDTRQREQ